MDADMDEERLLTRAEAARFLNDRGFPITPGQLSQLVHRGIGPTPEVLWGGAKRPLYRPSTILEWAKSRCIKPAEPVAA
jgi:hypothetical protein